eukprot:CAMPEP_0198108088 /NCGR_PEP_ID=MMETSP1442-20131203/177_1 /TAXON_ID= /ORGANISM="Craspedostauros australis, Strain CCMP3328" /LENGTH=196 /DNA_ID=CAMNT_0043763289 /DNA_START=63 /DNA_END=653 /DNA_ORIENTATION=-
MKLALILTALTGASAFAPTAQAPRTSAIGASSIDEIRGATLETGGKPWDPLELAQWAPVDHLRKAELANGRSAMLATVGWVFPRMFGTFDGPVDTTDPILAFGKADPQWWAQFIVFCAVIEGIKFRGEMNGKSFTGEIDKEAALDWTSNWGKMDDKAKEDMAMKELKNGRLAMIGIASFVANYYIPGSVPGLSEGF